MISIVLLRKALRDEFLDGITLFTYTLYEFNSNQLNNVLIIFVKISH